MDLEPNLSIAVAEAAEKYIVYGAMNTFLTRMQWLAFRFHLVGENATGKCSWCPRESEGSRRHFDHL